MKKIPKLHVAGVTWYTEENWLRVKASALDPERFEATYTEWNAMATEAFANLQRTGINVVKFSVRFDQLLPWCLLHNKPNNASSRAEFVSEMLRFQHAADA